MKLHLCITGNIPIYRLLGAVDATGLEIEYSRLLDTQDVDLFSILRPDKGSKYCKNLVYIVSQICSHAQLKRAKKSQMKRCEYYKSQTFQLRDTAKI